MVFPGAEWEGASPEAQGLDPDKLQAAISYLQANAGRDGVRELVIICNGYIVWNGDNIDHVHGVWSLTKSFTSTVLGLLIDDGKATLDTKACQFVPELAEYYPEVTLRHFATMTSGYRAVGDEPQGTYIHGPSKTPFDPGPLPLFTPPGSRYAYWDSAMNEFANVLTQIAGEPIEDLFTRRIADPIGMTWDWGDLGVVEGIRVNCGSGNSNQHVRVSARELARLGHLFLNRGKWNGTQLISSSWVEAATTTRVPADVPLGHGESGIDGRGVYGYNWWTNGVKADGERKWPGAPPGTFSASGYNNNDMFVIPEWQTAVVRLGLDQATDGPISDATYAEFLRLIGEAIDSPSENGDAR